LVHPSYDVSGNKLLNLASYTSKQVHFRQGMPTVSEAHVGESCKKGQI